MCGYMDRQSTKASTEKHKQQLREEKEYIEQLANFIKASDFFCGLNANERKGIMKGNWRAGNSWGSLGEKAGFHRVYLDNIYSFLCGYSHTSFISALQVKQSQMLEDQGFLAGTILGFASKIISHFIFSYCDVFPGACKFLDNEDGIRKIANKWCFSADEMDDFYHDKT